MTEIVVDVVGVNTEVIWGDTKPDGIILKLLDISRLESAGWRPRIDLVTGIRNTYDSYQHY